MSRSKAAPDHHTPVRAGGMTILTLILSWGLALGGVLSITVPIVLLVAAAYHLRGRRWLGFAIVSLLNPLTVNYLLGVRSYSSETPRLIGAGLPAQGYFNLTQAERCYRTNTGCLISGGEWISHDLHNLGLRTMVLFFGSPPNSYSGPYPDAGELLARWQDEGAPYSPAVLESRGIPPERLSAVRATIEKNIKFLAFGEELSLRQTWLPLGEEGLAVRLTMDRPEIDLRDDLILLFDIPHGRLFAVYGLEGQPTQRRFPQVLPGT